MVCKQHCTALHDTCRETGAHVQFRREESFELRGTGKMMGEADLGTAP